MTSQPQFANSAEPFVREREAVEPSRLPEPLEDEIRAIYRRSPLYAERFPLHPEPLHWACYREIPALSKEEIVARGAEAFFQNYTEVERGLQEARYEYESTGGTTQRPMTVIMERGWWEAQTERAYRASPILREFVGRRYRKCVLAPVGCSSNLCPYEDHAFPNRYFDGTVYLNLSSDPFSFPESEWDRIVLELQATKPEVLEGEPVYLSLLARALARRGVRVPSVRVVILTYGKASRQHAARVSEVFPGARLVDLYGSTEAGYLFVGEAFCDNAQPVEENAFIELASFDWGAVGVPPTSGRAPGTGMPNERGCDRDVREIVVTTRGREAMPLLRYRTGDLVRKLPSGYRVLGRARDLYWRPHDSALISVYEVDAALPGDFACWHYQLVQTSAARWDFYYVADATYPAAKLEAALAELLGAGQGSSVRVNAFRRRVIAPSASGKFSPLRLLSKVSGFNQQVVGSH
ncbi:CoF synthetase [Cephaloticoccus capnophilus]|uniref:CoF synthetase n=1 Tax=Cephaloticoccus capnophilus TaxID=1548208 RepID=A0A139SIQ4_9BACT|nr:CoF synthetase [Cephaloticoccus capnophilus]KXU34413.1 CoF synthetase [Cephaloticoccus capnophilus]